MSFQYAQYGEGFDLIRPSPYALNFEELVQHRGETITIVRQIISGYNSYGQPIRTENSYTEYGFVKKELSGYNSIPGYIRIAKVSAFLRQWAPVEVELHEIEYHGQRYYIVGIEKTPAYLEIKAESRVSLD